MPAEIRPQSKRKLTSKPVRVKRVKVVPTEIVEQKMKILEQKEKDNPDGDDKSVKGDNESDEEGENVRHYRNFGVGVMRLIYFNVWQDEEKMEDNEMDDDIDYGCNYFDNGEGFNDEDDNLEEGDGPIY